ncbi:hypothetical protein [Shewanella fidelis]|nr:hypothetical protein [Shewanella fidelis]
MKNLKKLSSLFAIFSIFVAAPSFATGGDEDDKCPTIDMWECYIVIQR